MRSISRFDARFLVAGINDREYAGWVPGFNGFDMSLGSIGKVHADSFQRAVLELHGTTDSFCTIPIRAARLYNDLEMDLTNGLTIIIPVEG